MLCSDDLLSRFPISCLAFEVGAVSSLRACKCLCNAKNNSVTKYSSIILQFCPRPADSDPASEQVQLLRTTQGCGACFPGEAMLPWLPSLEDQFAVTASALKEGADNSVLLPTSTLLL